MVREKSPKLQRKLIQSYVLVVLIPMLIISVAMYFNAISSIQKNSLEIANLLSNQIDMNLNNVIEEYDTISKSIIVDSDILFQISGFSEKSMSEKIDYNSEVRKILNRIVMMKPDALSIILYTPDVIYYYDRLSGILKEDVLRNQWETYTFENSNLFITGIHVRDYFNTSYDRPVFTYSRKFFDKGGAYIGTLLIDIEPTDLIEINDTSAASMKQYGIQFIISNQRREIVYHSAVSQKNVKWDNFVRQKVPELDTSGSKEIIVSSKTNNGQLNNTIVISKKALFAEVNQSKYFLIASILLSLIIVTIVSNILSKRLTVPFKLLQKNMHNVENEIYTRLEYHHTSEEMDDLIISYNSMVDQIKKLINEVYISKIKQQKAELLALQSQINPHMLFNTLESIRMKALVSENVEIADMIKILARIYKVVLGKDNITNTLEDEVKFVTDYIKIQNIRYDNHFHLEVRLEEVLNKLPLIPFILQPIVENSVQHGFRGYDHVLHITIRGFICSDHSYVLYIEDDGKGMSRSEVQRLNHVLQHKDIRREDSETEENVLSGIGLINIATRIKLTYGTSSSDLDDNKYGLLIHSEENKYTRIELTLPYPYKER